ncbi:hypothetical protein GOP47_0011364 [Adiantum capillus-veneris]|uniref:Uncharacterized protein n=1 Tax=Adiantum capillus-veneris TaxID=13818 RepID=A0A9D4UT51_ADICA|nr:hypothetical protein GOP47_0011364 [Adiantum capillus-veneris]
MVKCRTWQECKPSSRLAYGERGEIVHCSRASSNGEADPKVEEQEKEMRRKEAILWCCVHFPARSGCRLDRSVWRHASHGGGQIFTTVDISIAEARVHLDNTISLNQTLSSGLHDWMTFIYDYQVEW